MKRRRKNNSVKGLIILAIILVVAIAAVFGIMFAKAKKKTSDEKETKIIPETVTAPEITTEETTTEPETGDGRIEGTNGQTIYLTFDDGPSDNTYAVLDILDQYGVKATFFVLENWGRADQLKEIVNKGHEVGVHSSCHDYDTLYANLDSFKQDVYACRDFIESTTGRRPFLYRFPGGTNNQVHEVSISACIDFLRSEDLTHFDWNISSGDAAGNTVDTDTIVDNVLSRIHDNDNGTLVVLMHDSAAKTTTIEALRTVLPILIDEGYGFSRITRETPQIYFDAYD